MSYSNIYPRAAKGPFYMFFSILKLVVIAGLISFSSWLAGRKPELAGFIIAMPITSMIALILSYVENKNDSESIIFAKSVLIAVPVSWLFFLPFFFAERLGYGFWFAFVSGFLLLIPGYFIHKFLIALF